MNIGGMVAWIMGTLAMLATQEHCGYYHRAMVLLGLSLASGSSAPVRIDHEGGEAAWVTGTLVAPSMQGY